MRHEAVSHERAIRLASKRYRITRFENLGNKTVRVVYSLVHSTNKADLAKAGRKQAFGVVAED